MTREQLMTLFEKACANWGFDFDKDDSGPNGVIYASYETGIMFGMFMQGFDTAKEHYVVTE
jgi:hypothetical protein